MLKCHRIHVANIKIWKNKFHNFRLILTLPPNKQITQHRLLRSPRKNVPVIRRNLVAVKYNTDAE